MSRYRTCPLCGAHLDSGELCDCIRQQDTDADAQLHSQKTDAPDATAKSAAYEMYETYKNALKKGENVHGFQKGDAFNLGGVFWNVIETGADWLKCISVETVAFRPFDQKNSNDFASSDLRAYLNEDFLNRIFARGVDRAIFKKFPIDLTACDGLDYYGWDLTTVGLITCDEYREARKYIRPAENCWWWMATPDSTKNNYVRGVAADGSVGYSAANTKTCGVRPVCLLDTERLAAQKEKDKRNNAVSMMRFIQKRWKINENEVY